MAGALSASSTDPVQGTADLQTSAQGLLDYADNITEGEELMFIMDVPYVPVQETAIVLSQASIPGAGGVAPVGVTAQPDYLLKTCSEFSSGGGGLVDPIGMLAVELGNRSNRDILSSLAKDTINIAMLEATAHGKLIAEVDNKGVTSYLYHVESGYLGNDKAVFLAEFEGKRYRVVINFVITEAIDENSPQCPASQLIKVNGKPVSGSTSYDLNTITVTFADLSGSALGQTNTAGITLDTAAAGYNWFIDTTPGQNEEFLPTSNPNEWVAKEGSAAAGKMDMLSVLLHEYGHALGINHSADPIDFMGTTLTAGVRRLPTADEMALMQGLVAEAKASLTLSPSPANGGGEFPSIPLGTSFIGFLGLLRSSRYGGVSIAPDANTLVTQYAWAANTTLVNGSLNAADGWSTLGSVDIGPASTGSGQASTSSGRTGGGATLNEISGSQTRLSQVFLLNPTDRFLSFTLSGTALDDLTGAPDDAFEVALLDANTGASLLNGTGQTRTDAFLNLQADGTQNLANCVTCINNADGSRTYRVDLAGVPAGVAANL